MEYLALIIAQAIYTASDTWKKVILSSQPFGLKVLTSPIFLFASAIAILGFIAQMYALSRMDLSRAIITLGMLAVVFSALAGTLYLKEYLSPINLIGVALALLAIILVNIR